MIKHYCRVGCVNTEQASGVQKGKLEKIENNKSSSNAHSLLNQWIKWPPESQSTTHKYKIQADCQRREINSEERVFKKIFYSLQRSIGSISVFYGLNTELLQKTIS